MMLKALIYALCAGAGGAIVGSFFDSGAEHLHGLVCGLIGAIAGFCCGAVLRLPLRKGD
jgi:hypothetical protein